MKFDYIAYRKDKKSGRYKLLRRSSKMIESINKFRPGECLSILDVGATDGFMLEQYRMNLNVNYCFGIEPSMEYIRSKTSAAALIQGIGERLPFRNSTFDIITASSVLDHMSDPVLFLREGERVLKKGGVILISLVHPFYDKLAVRFRVKNDDHQSHFNEMRLKELLDTSGFELAEMSRFALPTCGFIFGRRFEKVLSDIGIKWPMFYILAAAKVRR